MKLKLLAVIAGFSIVLAGCGSQKAQEAAYEQEKAKIVEKSHDHDHDDHDHDDHEDDHDHHHDPVYGGVLVELGDHVGNVEFLLSEDGTTLTAHVFDAHAENAVRLAQPTLELEVRSGAVVERVVLKGVANPLTGETLGDTSEFSGRVQTLQGQGEFEAELKSIDFKGILFEGVVFSYSAEKE